MTILRMTIGSALIGVLYGLAALGVSLTVNAAHGATPAAVSMAASKPLLVVRFNQPTVYYRKPLRTALTHAMLAKPDVVFNVVSYIPTTGHEQRDLHLIAKANKHLMDFMNAARQLGVGPQQVRVATQLEPGLKYDEIHVYVQ